MASIANVTKKKAERNRFIKALREHRSVTKACEAIGKSRVTAYRWRDEDPEFKAAWDEAVEQNIDDLEACAYRRAIEGWLEPVYFQGKAVGAVRKFSNALTIFMLKKLRPKIYADTLGERMENFEAIKDETFL